MSEPKLKKLPVLLSDEEAERFIDTADLSEHDLSGFRPMRFEVAPKDGRVNMRLPGELLAAVEGPSEPARPALPALHPRGAGERRGGGSDRTGDKGEPEECLGSAGSIDVVGVTEIHYRSERLMAEPREPRATIRVRIFSKSLGGR
jgi:hypothetical protein